MRESANHQRHSRIRFTRRSLSPLRWPLGLVLVVLLPWLPAAIVLSNYLPLPLAPPSLLSYMAWLQVARAGEQVADYVLGVGGLAGTLTALLWLARSHAWCQEPVASWFIRLEAIAQILIEPAVRHGAALIGMLLVASAGGLWLGLHLPWGWTWLLALPLGLLATALVLVPAAAATRWRGRQWAQAVVALALACAGAQVERDATIWVELRVYRSAAVRAEPLCAAIERFTNERGRVPISLDELVPGYLATLPRTGWCATPRYEYLPIAARLRWTNAPSKPYTMSIDGRGRAVTTYPGPYDTATQALRALGPPSTLELMAHWQLRLALPELSMDDQWLVTRDGWSGQRFGRWRFVAW